MFSHFSAILRHLLSIAGSHMSFYQIIAVGLGGMIGSIGRYLTVKSIDEKFASTFPYGTLTVNILGSLILGFIFALISRKAGLAEHWRLFFGTGICGGFTTFSALALENFNLLHFKPGTALLYTSLSLAAGILAIGVGYMAGKTF
jgi:fluoride exporter